MSSTKKRKKIVVDIDAQVSKRIRKEHVPKVPKEKSQTDYKRKDVLEWFSRHSRKGETVVSDSEYKRLSAERQFKAFAYSEVERQYRTQRHSWYERFQRVEGTGYKKKVPSHKFDKTTGEKVYKERTRTFYTWRDRITGRFVSYDNQIIVRNKRTGELVYKPKPGKTVRNPLTGRFEKKVSVKESRKEMRKELTIHKIAERKRITVKDARKLYREFEREGMDRYLMKEYAKTPD